MKHLILFSFLFLLSCNESNIRATKEIHSIEVNDTIVSKNEVQKYENLQPLYYLNTSNFGAIGAVYKINDKLHIINFRGGIAVIE